MPSTLRKLLSTDCKIGGITIPAARLSGGGDRRLQPKRRPMTDGAEHTDMGEDARVETIQATLAEDVYQKLVNMRRAGRVVAFVHPLFGSFQARIQGMRYEAGPRSHVDATITIVEEGEPGGNVIDFTDETKTLSTARQIVRGKAADVFADLTAVGDLPDLPLAVITATASLQAKYTSFDIVLADVERGDQAWPVLAGAWNDMALAASLMLTALDAATDSDFEDLYFSDADDLIPVFLWAGREAVLAAQTVAGIVWTTFLPTAPVLLLELADEFLGEHTDAAVDTILDANPELIDVLYVSRGTPINLPVRIQTT